MSADELATLDGERAAIMADLARQARAEIGQDVCSSGMSASACSTAIDAEIERQRQNGNRIGGAIDLVFGGAEILGSVYLCGQSAGMACNTASLALAAHGADTSIAGARALITSESTEIRVQSTIAGQSRLIALQSTPNLAGNRWRASWPASRFAISTTR